MYLILIQMLLYVLTYIFYDITFNFNMHTLLFNCIYLTLILLKIIRCIAICNYMYILLLSKISIFIFNVFTIKNDTYF